ncbi:hypothetical protein G6F65_016870 [Rhizopus arrhizus]|nr:hypothetical protein G6F65_016870 [Rhizopus arrhizus]
MDQHFGGSGGQGVAHRIRKVCRVGTHHQVAHVGDHESAGDAGALYLGNGRFRKVPDAQAIAVIAARLVVPALFHGEVRALGLGFLQVVARRKMRASSGQHHDPHGIVLLGARQGVVQFIQHLLALGIARRLARQADAPYRVKALDGQGGVFHSLLVSCYARARHRRGSTGLN